MVKVMALDVGSKRIGLALSDPKGIFAFPHGMIPKDSRTIENLQRLIEEESVEEIVAGLPLLLSGKEGDQAEWTRAFIEELKRSISIPIHFQDERLSSAEAEKRLLEADVSRKGRKANRDAIAAALILESFLRRRQAGS